jgi:hypothetical protein
MPKASWKFRYDLPAILEAIHPAVAERRGKARRLKYRTRKQWLKRTSKEKTKLCVRPYSKNSVFLARSETLYK